MFGRFKRRKKNNSLALPEAASWGWEGSLCWCLGSVAPALPKARPDLIPSIGPAAAGKADGGVLGPLVSYRPLNSPTLHGSMERTCFFQLHPLFKPEISPLPINLSSLEIPLHRDDRRGMMGKETIKEHYYQDFWQLSYRFKCRHGRHCSQTLTGSQLHSSQCG